MIDPGDVVPVMRLDRLAPSTRNLLSVFDKIGQAGAQLESLRKASSSAS